MLSSPVVSHSGWNIPSSNLLSLSDWFLWSQLQLEASSLDVVCVTDAVTVDEAVDGVENNPWVLLQSSALKLHTIHLEYPDTSVYLLLRILYSAELGDKEGHDLNFDRSVHKVSFWQLKESIVRNRTLTHGSLKKIDIWPSKECLKWQSFYRLTLILTIESSIKFIIRE